MDEDSSASSETTIFRFGSFTFDCGSQLLSRDGVERHLSPKARHLLRLLLVARPRALSRQELYDQLWPSTYVCETNMAGVVSELRRALGDDGAQFIRTVHGFGYAFSGAVTSAAATPAVFLWCEGQRHPLHEGENTVGRAPECTVVLTDYTVSRRHARLTLTDNAISIEDLGSKNGTYVDSRRIRRSTVTRHMRIEFGGVAALIVSSRPSSTGNLHLAGSRAEAGPPSDPAEQPTLERPPVGEDERPRRAVADRR